MRHKPPLQRHGIVPFAGAAEIVKRDALARDDAGGPANQPLPPIIITQAGMCAEAANTSIFSPQPLRIDRSRPVFVEASLMPATLRWCDSRSMTLSVRSLRWKFGLV